MAYTNGFIANWVAPPNVNIVGSKNSKGIRYTGRIKEELREQGTFPKTKEGYDQRKEVDEEIKRLEKIVEDTNKQYTQNKAEVYRMEV